MNRAVVASHADMDDKATEAATGQSRTSAPLPLAGLRVVEVGLVVAGPFCGSLLADMGATVIKVERPGEGDPARQMGPRIQGVSVWSGVASRDKCCVALDLGTEEGRRSLLHLLHDADVLVENFRPGAMERLGLGADVLTRHNPTLTVVNISGFGLNTRDASRPGFGKIAEGLSGIVSLTGAESMVPLHVGFSLADTTSGLMGCLGAMMALYERDVRTVQVRGQAGRGRRVDIALYEPLLRMTELQMALQEKGAAAPSRRGTNDPYAWGASEEPARRYVAARCAGGEEILVQVDNVAAGQLEPYIGAANWRLSEFDDRLRAWLATKTVQVIAAQLRTLGIEASRVQDGLSMSADPYYSARGDVLPVSNESIGAFHVVGHVPRRSMSGRRPFRAADVGEDNDAVFDTTS